MVSKHLIKKILVTAFIHGICFSCIAQTTLIKEINSINPPSVALMPFRFLASDELMGRGTMRPEINIAARYISEYFKSIGVRELQGAQDYFQPFDIKMITPSKTGGLTVNSHSYEIGPDLLQIRGEDISISAPVIYAGFGLENELDKLDVKGKILVTNTGASDSSTFRQSFGLIETKIKLAQEKGAIALVERFRPSGLSWDMLKRYLLGEHLKNERSGNFPVFFINDRDADIRPLIQVTGNGLISVTGTRVKTTAAKNVLGWVEGTDAKLKNQFIVLTAHYDHLGVAQESKMEEGKLDSIYNGARDNAIGVTAVMDAARYFAQHPPKRSVLFIAYTAEEIGEVGSKYFAAHPAVPLRQMVYNLNIDNASYNDTTIVSVVGLGRTSADEDIKRGCGAYGLTAMPDPAPEENLFDRSDNVNLAVKGIPAPTFSLGIRKFDSTINNRYHQLSDEVGNFSATYAVKYIDAFILTAKYIADNPAQPLWVKGDKYEAAWKELYRKPL